MSFIPHTFMSYLLHSDHFLSCFSKLSARLLSLLTVRRATRWSVTATGTGKHLRDRPLNLLPGRDAYGRRLPQALRIEANFMVTFVCLKFPEFDALRAVGEVPPGEREEKLRRLHINGCPSPSGEV